MGQPTASWSQLCRELGLDEGLHRFVGPCSHSSLGAVYAKLWRAKAEDPWRWQSSVAREAQNLSWLIARGFEAPKPVLYKIEREFFGRLRFEALLSQAIPASDLARLAEAGRLSSADLHALGQVVSRLHRSGFRHRDLYLRNILKTETGFAFLDCRKGGTNHKWLRGVRYDLACLDLWLAELLSPEHRRAFFLAYSEGSPLSKRELQRINEQRRALAAALARKSRTGKAPRLEQSPIEL